MRKRKRAAFTLIELLVVIGIIVLVVSVTIPMVMRSYRAGDRARSAADIQTVSLALEAFKGDFGDYPRPTDNTGAVNTGFALLGRYLIGPNGDGLDTSQNPPIGDPNDPPVYTSSGTYDVGSCVRNGSLNPPQGPTYVAVATPGTAAPNATPGPNDVWQLFNVNDGVDGPGLKNNGRGKTLGPYLQPDKFKVRGMAILDRSGAPILYFVRSPGARNVHAANPGNTPSYAGSGLACAYNTDDNEMFFRQSGDTDKTDSTKAIQMLMGDTNANGYIDGNETEVNLPYILWAAGPDGVFCPYRTANTDPTTPGVWTSNMLQKYDDVTNFR